MATQNQLIPVITSGKFTGQASTDIDSRIAKSKNETLATVDAKLGGKLDAVTFQNYVDNLPATSGTGGSGTGGAVSVVDNGDGTLTIG